MSIVLRPVFVHCFKTLCLRHSTVKLYMCGIRFMYLKAGIPCLLLGGGSSCVRIYTLLNAKKKKFKDRANVPDIQLLGLFRDRCVGF